MKITVLGTGVVGQTIAEKFSQLGNEVMIGTRDVKETLAKTKPDNFGRPAFKDWYAGHSNIKFGTYAEAASFGEFVVNATNGAGSLQALELAGKNNLAKKILMDISNPLDFSKGFPPSLLVSNTDSLAEQIQKKFSDALVVKTLNTMNAFIMVNPSILPEDHHVFLSGNDADAKAKVKEILRSFGWKEKNMIDLGDITSARGAEQILPIWVRLMGVLQNPFFNFKIVQGEAPKK
ncbi:MAG TPA: NAD(P)-binding domain-containing protein [Cyclobacteriaceae bacterium]|nr:NAD(P)-binding domain-containing protein [Cyclobacteriaceae bacterium]